MDKGQTEICRPCCQPTATPLLRINSSIVFPIWLLLSFMFTTASSTILTADEGSFVCHWPVSLSNMPRNSPLWRLFKRGNVNKEQRWQVSQTVTWLPFSPQWLTYDGKPCHKPPNNISSLSIGLDSNRGWSIHLQHFAFYKPIKLWSHGDGSNSNSGQIECLSGLVFNGQDMLGLLTIRACWKWIVRCTEADPISHSRKNTLNVCCIHACLTERWLSGWRVFNRQKRRNLHFQLTPTAEKKRTWRTFRFHVKSKVCTGVEVLAQAHLTRRWIQWELNREEAAPLRGKQLSQVRPVQSEYEDQW